MTATTPIPAAASTARPAATTGSTGGPCRSDADSRCAGPRVAVALGLCAGLAETAGAECVAGFDTAGFGAAAAGRGLKTTSEHE
ncbi:MAG: hypothetical protein IRZ05_19345 [Micromonosporaceae bacterium]|nr:hypothetical protein [Micromonosporaceae bacterium]